MLLVIAYCRVYILSSEFFFQTLKKTYNDNNVNFTIFITTKLLINFFLINFNSQTDHWIKFPNPFFILNNWTLNPKAIHSFYTYPIHTHNSNVRPSVIQSVYLQIANRWEHDLQNIKYYKFIQQLKTWKMFN